MAVLANTRKWDKGPAKSLQVGGAMASTVDKAVQLGRLTAQANWLNYLDVRTCTWDVEATCTPPSSLEGGHTCERDPGHVLPAPTLEQVRKA